MDSAPVRRGAPSAHEVWGNQVAVITGDLVFARASAIAADLGPVAIRILAATFERLCLGQLHETVGPPPGTDAVDHLSLIHISEPTRLGMISYAVFCLKKKKKIK